MGLMFTPRTKGEAFFSLLSFVLLSISHDTNQSVLSGSGLVPLHNACSYGHYEVTELLLKVRHDFLFDELVLLGLCGLVEMLLSNE